VSFDRAHSHFRTSMRWLWRFSENFLLMGVQCRSVSVVSCPFECGSNRGAADNHRFFSTVFFPCAPQFSIWVRAPVPWGPFSARYAVKNLMCLSSLAYLSLFSLDNLASGRFLVEQSCSFRRSLLQNCDPLPLLRARTQLTFGNQRGFLLHGSCLISVTLRFPPYSRPFPEPFRVFLFTLFVVHSSFVATELIKAL